MLTDLRSLTLVIGNMQDVEKPPRVLLGNAYPDLVARVVWNKVVLRTFAAVQGLNIHRSSR
jgi:hypothetical protein